MLVSDVLRYWYSVEIPKAPRRLQGFILVTADAFSMPLLLRTLFAPWRKDVISTRNLALPERMRVFWYNLVSIFIGFFVRLFVLSIASLAVVLILLGGVVFLALWVVLPGLILVLFFAGVVLLFR